MEPSASAASSLRPWGVIATMLLRDGMPPGDVAAESGYFDQAHLTRSVRRLIGLTPGGLAREERQLSFLYKTDDSLAA